MKFQFIANACGIFIGSEGTRILCDPWIADGVFEGSWCHFPALTTKQKDIRGVDAIYVSHIHPDHFDERSFDFDLGIPIFILQRPNNFLERRLCALGYTNLHLLESRKVETFREFSLAIYEPFTAHNFHEAEIGNVIDSALVIESSGIVAFNANDNTPTPSSCQSLLSDWGKIDLAMLNYNAAGPYPACFDNLSLSEKHSEHSRLLNRNMNYLLELLEALAPRACLPFAGAYVLGGKLSEKNQYLGTTTWDKCARFLRSRISSVEIVTLRELDVLDIQTLESSRAYVPLDEGEQERYINNVLSKIKYPYERDEVPDANLLSQDLKIACDRMMRRAEVIGLSTTFTVGLRSGTLSKQLIPHFDDVVRESDRHLACEIDPRLLRRILDRKSQWNSAEIGCHISFVRTPNEYEPDLHTILQFLHL